MWWYLLDHVFEKDEGPLPLARLPTCTHGTTIRLRVRPHTSHTKTHFIHSHRNTDLDTLPDQHGTHPLHVRLRPSAWVGVWLTPA